MPLITKGGKYIYGWSKVQEDGFICLPQEAVREYKLKADSKLILISGSKTSGGFVVSNREMLSKSSLKSIFEVLPGLGDYSIEQGRLVKYKGRRYCWTAFEVAYCLRLSEATRDGLAIKGDDLLLAIRSSNIGFACIARGPIVQRAAQSIEIVAVPGTGSI